MTSATAPKLSSDAPPQPRLKRALFVGSDPARFDRMRQLMIDPASWEAALAPDTRSAIEMLNGTAPIDVVVTDASLKRTESDTLLAETRERHPRVACVSFAQGNDASHLSASSTHVVSLASDPKVLRTLLDKTFNLHQALTDDTVRLLVGRLDKLPSVPQTYRALMEAAARPDISIAAVGAIVERDPAMSLKVLQMVNSAFFGLSRRITSIQHAVSYLGLELIKGLALTAHVFTAFEGSKVKNFSIDRFQSYSLRVARIAQKMVSDREQANMAFTAAILHDIGKLALAMRAPDDYTRITDRFVQGGEALEVVEREIIGTSHAEVGAYLLFMWGIPFQIVESVAFHHRPNECVGPSEVLTAVHVADALVGIVTAGEPEHRIDLSYLESVGALDRLPHWRRIVEDECRMARPVTGRGSSGSIRPTGRPTRPG